jgi:hypothetical protein
MTQVLAGQAPPLLWRFTWWWKNSVSLPHDSLRDRREQRLWHTYQVTFPATDGSADWPRTRLVPARSEGEAIGRVADRFQVAPDHCSANEIEKG